MYKLTTIEKVVLLQEMIENKELIIFHEGTKVVHDGSELTVSVNGKAIQIFIKEEDGACSLE